MSWESASAISCFLFRLPISIVPKQTPETEVDKQEGKRTQWSPPIYSFG